MLRGRTDDTGAIQKALNAAPAGGMVVFPVGHYRNGASRVRIQSVLATTRIAIAGTSLNTSISDSMVEQIVIGTDARRTILASVSVNLSGTQHPDIEDHATDTAYMAVTDINPVDWFGTIGIGRRSPNSNPVGLTPNLKLDVDGTVRAQAYATGDIHFYNDGRHVQRLFEDEQGLYLENTHTGAVSRVFLESDLTPLATRVAA
jgi:hypothetical protein